MNANISSKCVFFVLFTIYNVLEANHDSESNKIVLHNGIGYLDPYPEKCLDILNIFAQAASNFTLCSIINARPIKLCENCVINYVTFQTKFKELVDTVINGTSCFPLFVSQDRLDVVLDYHANILAIWDKGHCNDCFDWTEGTPNLSNNTMKFNKMFKTTIDCITTNLNPYKNDSDEVCVKCMQSYIRLDEFYKTLSKDSIGVDSVCMDIVDSMNTTRSIWSKNLHCCDLRKTPEILFLCCSVFISLLLLLFYVTVRYYGPIRDLPNVLKESRFKQSILRSVQGRIN